MQTPRCQYGRIECWGTHGLDVQLEAGQEDCHVPWHVGGLVEAVPVVFAFRQNHRHECARPEEHEEQLEGDPEADDGERHPGAVPTPASQQVGHAGDDSQHGGGD